MKSLINTRTIIDKSLLGLDLLLAISLGIAMIAFIVSACLLNVHLLAVLSLYYIIGSVVSLIILKICCMIEHTSMIEIQK